jgi:hypothetical protein
MSGPGFKFVVEPLGPEQLDDGNGGVLDSVPDLAPLLAMQLDASGALAAATTAITTGDLQNLYGLSNGTFDTANIQLMDPTYEADWLVPYLRDGAYTGAVLVSSYTGEIEQATWLDAIDGFDPFSLDELTQMYEDIFAGIIPNGNPVTIPEPAGVTMLCLVLIRLTVVRRRRA